MKYRHILITGGAGFVGSNISILLKRKYKNANITVFDNLVRKGSELNVPRLEKEDINFIKGDIRSRDELTRFDDVDLIIECAAEPSVMAGVGSSPTYIVDTNLIGAINCLDVARKNKADFIFLSTSRVYPVDELNKLSYQENDTRFILDKKQNEKGSSEKGVSEEFQLGKIRTLYGATKLAAELIAQEYANNYDFKVVINRCGVITGPWQFGKVDQGVVALWVMQHIYNKSSLSYIGFGGKGKQVRDFLHVEDLFSALLLQIKDMGAVSGEIFNLGGGLENSFSLLELTKVCEEVTGNKIVINNNPQTRIGDLKLYLTDYSKFNALTGWKPKKDLKTTIQDINNWILENKESLKEIL